MCNTHLWEPSLNKGPYIRSRLKTGFDRWPFSQISSRSYLVGPFGWVLGWVGLDCPGHFCSCTRRLSLLHITAATTINIRINHCRTTIEKNDNVFCLFSIFVNEPFINAMETICTLYLNAISLAERDINISHSVLPSLVLRSPNHMDCVESITPTEKCILRQSIIFAKHAVSNCAANYRPLQLIHLLLYPPQASRPFVIRRLLWHSMGTFFNSGDKKDTNNCSFCCFAWNPVFIFN